MSVANPLVSIIIVTFNSADMLPRCLAALATTTYAPFEIVVVDNHSTDGTAELLDRLPEASGALSVRRIRSETNLGFGRGCTLGAEAASGELLLFLNPDVVVVAGWLEQLVATLQTYPNSIISPATLLPHAIPQPAQRVSAEAAVPGAAMLVPRNVWRALGGFDPHFFLYWEDTDLCWRAWLHGFQVLTDQGAYVFHQRGGSAGSQRWDAERAKNSLRTYLKLMRWRKTVPFVLALALKTAVKAALLREPAMLAAWRWNWQHLGLTLAERRAILAQRQVDPSYLEWLIDEHDRRMRAERREREKS